MKALVDMRCHDIL